MDDTFYLISDRLKDDKDIILEGIKQNSGYVLKYASDRLKDDKDIVMEAVKRGGHCLIYASNRLKNDKELICLASEENLDDPFSVFDEDDSLPF